MAECTFCKATHALSQAAHRAAALPARLLEECTQYLKYLFVAWALASRAFATDQTVKLFKVWVSENPLWDFAYLGNLDIGLKD